MEEGKTIVKQIGHGLLDAFDLLLNWKCYAICFDTRYTIGKCINCVLFLSAIFYGVEVLYRLIMHVLEIFVVKHVVYLTVISWIYTILWPGGFYISTMLIYNKLFLTISNKCNLSQGGDNFLAEIAKLIQETALMLGILPCIFLLKMIPYIGTLLFFIYYSWYNAYFIISFTPLPSVMMEGDYNKEMLRKQIVEDRWAYYLGFGLPITILCFPWSFFYACHLYSFFFPCYLLVSSTYKNYSRGLRGDSLMTIPPIAPFRYRIFEYAEWINEHIVLKRIISENNLESLINFIIFGDKKVWRYLKQNLFTLRNAILVFSIFVVASILAISSIYLNDVPDVEVPDLGLV